VDSDTLFQFKILLEENVVDYWGRDAENSCRNRLPCTLWKLNL